MPGTSPALMIPDWGSCTKYKLVHAPNEPIAANEARRVAVVSSCFAPPGRVAKSDRLAPTMRACACSALRPDGRSTPSRKSGQGTTVGARFE
jgi:hypothetical protein